MECPLCGERLRALEKYGTEIDICPGCKGIWLARGKLEAIINLVAARAGELAQTVKAGASLPPAQVTLPEEQYYVEQDYRDEHHGRHRDEHHDHDDHQAGHGRQRRRGSWLEDLLGVFGGDD
jgi:Zn-finger nucleic acid-binding protein